MERTSSMRPSVSVQKHTHTRGFMLSLTNCFERSRKVSRVVSLDAAIHHAKPDRDLSCLLFYINVDTFQTRFLPPENIVLKMFVANTHLG